MKNLFSGGLKDLGFKFNEPQGAYYIMMDVSSFGVKDDTLFCEWMAENAGVAAVPGSSFFKEDIQDYVRFHFAKNDDTLKEALERLSHLKEKVDKAGNVKWR